MHNAREAPQTRSSLECSVPLSLRPSLDDRSDLSQPPQGMQKKNGNLAGGILGFGTADRFLFLHLRFDLAVVWLCCFALCKIIPNSSAHKLSAMTEHFHYGVAASLVVGVVLLLLLGLFLVQGFVGFLSRLHPVVDSGLRNGPRSTLDSPMWDVYLCIV